MPAAGGEPGSISPVAATTDIEGKRNLVPAKILGRAELFGVILLLLTVNLNSRHQQLEHVITKQVLMISMAFCQSMSLRLLELRHPRHSHAAM